MTLKRYWPNWKYPLSPQLLSALDEYHILKVPLLGQHYTGGPEDWCGRTACSMVFNYYQVVQGPDFESKLITHWDAGQGHYVDLRYPGGQRAFHKVPTDSPHKALEGAWVSDLSEQLELAVVVPPPDFSATEKLNASHVLGFSPSKLLPYLKPSRRDEAALLASTPALIPAKLSLMLEALNANNPVIFYSGFSMREAAPIHLIVVCGYAWIADDTGRHLWLVVADPSTNNDKVHQPGRKPNIYTALNPGGGTDEEAFLQGKLRGEHDIIRIIRGDWHTAQASLVFIRARKLFEANTHSVVKDDLYMDYWDGDEKKGGTFIYSLKPTTVPDGFLFSNVAKAVGFPMDTHRERLRPANCYVCSEQAGVGLFPLGSQRNLHSGVHLELASFKPAQAAADASPAPNRQVRCLAPGYVVAVRLANALPEPGLKDAAKAGLEKNELSREFAGNHNSFILVRHDVEERPRKAPGEEGSQGGQQLRRFTFYSLYMHLAPPDWSRVDTYEGVGWLNMLARRDGSLTVVDPRHPAFQQVRWLQGSQGMAAPTEETPKLIPRLGGGWQVLGAGLGKPELFDLGDGSEGLVRGVLKKPDRDLTELHEALVGGKVVTLCHPYLKVRAGEVLGYLDERSSARGDGFLHWEVLAPSAPDQLQQFLSFAEEALGLSEDGKPFFKLFEEKNPNNFFDPPVVREGGGSEEAELDGLLALARLSRQAAPGQQDLLDDFRQTYSQQTLQQLLESAQALPFTASDDAPTAQPSYPVDVVIENYKSILTAGSYELRFTFEPSDLPPQEVRWDGRKPSVRIHVPARARKVFVEPKALGSFHVQPGGSGDGDKLKQDVQHFRNLAGVRWRNVVLRHLNEWYPENIVKQVRAHLKARKRLRLGSSVLDATKEQDAQALIQEYANAVGWWAHDETAVLGPRGGGAEGGEKRLFVDGPDAEQLPRDSLVDNPHPVTFTWLLMLMVRHGLIRFLDAPLWYSEEEQKVVGIGWLPAREAHEPQRVGELVYATAVQRGYGDHEVTVRVQHGGQTLELARGKFKDGLFAHPVELPGWGTWVLDAGEARAIGSLEHTGLTPSLMKAAAPMGEDGTQSATTDEAPVGRGDETFTWRVAFRENCPRVLRGWVLVRAWKGKQTDTVPTDAALFKPTGLAIPVYARETTAIQEELGFAVVDGFLRKGSVKKAGTYVTQHFTYQAYVDAAKGKAEPVLAHDLVEAVERIQCAYSARQVVTLSALAEDGLSLQLTGSSLEKLRAAVARAKDDGWIDDAEEAGKGLILIRVKPPRESRHPGELALDFNASAAFEKLREGLTHEDQLAVRFGCFFPNGGFTWDSRLLSAESLGKGVEAVDEEALKRESKAGFLELWSTGVAEVLHRPMFGRPQVRLTSDGVQFVVPFLGGTTAFWKATAPVIHLGIAELDKNPRSSILADPPRVVRKLLFTEEKAKNQVLTVLAKAKKDAPLKGERVDVPDSEELRYDMQPDALLETQPRADDAFMLTVIFRTQALPSGKGFKLEVSSASAPVDAKTQRPPPLTLQKKSLVYKTSIKDGVALTDAEGVIRAELNLADVKVALKGEQRFTVWVVPVAKADKSLARDATLELPAPLHPPSMEEDALMNEPFQGMWPELQNIPWKGEGGYL
ncbi:hypothetical protein [Pyxidicoccus xibeiensis]|uniref:hypothetical protein n=1 Tax=Pyxidicoccus xibeiensis TaxID=2906759 RepID=UPI0020A70739|nr:hypothetical protein [Pyxidicoccus xibeiensis]MCP3142900.1 hypothetical protein [Pyxidicoccus xibeiensis]